MYVAGNMLQLPLEREDPSLAQTPGSVQEVPSL